MRRNRLLPMLSAALLASLAAQADEPETADDVPPPASSAAPAAALESLPRYSTRWQLRDAAPEPAQGYDYASPLTAIVFEDGSVISRVSRIRRLSLLTFAEIGDAQLYFGVNREGLFGVHLGALSGSGGERQLEVARMPYLKGPGAADETKP